MANPSDQQTLFISFNCDGFNNNWHAVHHLLFACHADVVAIQEHWLAPAQLHQLQSLAESCGFACLCSSAMEERVASSVVKGRGHGGLAIFTRSSTITEVRRISMDTTRLLAVHFKKAGLPYSLLNAYLPYNAKSDATAMVDYLECLAYIGEFADAGTDPTDIRTATSLVLLGDFNCDFARGDAVATPLRSCVADAGLKFADIEALPADTVSYINKNGGKSWIDHAAISVGICRSRTRCHFSLPPASKSPHLALSLQLSFPSSDDPKHVSSSSPRCSAGNPATKWSIASDCDLQLYRAAVARGLATVDWSILLKPESTVSMLDERVESFIDIISSSAVSTLRTRSIGKQKGGGKRWWNDELEQLKQRCCFWRFLWTEAAKPRQGHVFRIFSSVKSTYKYACRNFKKAGDFQRWNDLATSSSNAEFWSRARSLNGSGTNPDNIRIVDGKCSSSDLAETFAKHFEDACSPWNKPAADCDAQLLTESYRIRFAGERRDDATINADEVSMAIHRLKAGKAADIHGLSSEHLQHADVAKQIACILSAMLRLRYFPRALRDSLFFPLLKGSGLDRTVCSSYRGIAVAPVLSKVYEAVFALRNGAHLETRSSQYAYKSAMSCSTCAHDLLSLVERYRSAGSSVHMMFLDASKAFDKVVHPKLCNKLLQRGIAPGEVALFEQSLNTSRGRVRVNGGPLSRPFLLKAGVRQGSLLGGTMWTVYVDELLHRLQNLGVGCRPAAVFAYADDVCLVAPTAAGLRALVAEVERFSESHQIRLNPDKSWLLTVGRDTSPTIALNARTVRSCNRVKYLGFELQLQSRGRRLMVDDLPITQNFLKASNGILGIPNCPFPLLRAHLLRVYTRPIIDFGLQLHDFLPVTALGRMQIAMSKVARRACGLHRSCSVNIACAVVGWLPVSFRSGQLRVLRHDVRLLDPALANSPSDYVARLRMQGHKAKIAANAAFRAACTSDHSERARIIHALLAAPDVFARAMAFNISKPSCL